MSAAAARCAAVLAAALWLGACAQAPAAPPGTQVTAEQVRAIRPGQSTRASLLASLGATRKVAFDNGVETWLYQLAVPGGFDEIVALLDPQGVVRKVRRRAQIPPSRPAS
ncbi:hypothetical protein [Massilia sp. CCM 8734]|uniref:hypothetical protein n=1 Tax=Massilia sp. CCM 8734 TaxID=2609283 RepID=UPI001E2D11DA|nr:hypothetical protein [Massilia sp. CCM 8734]